MAEFECDRCGKCCVSLGPLITIERQLNDRDYYCRCKIDNAIFLARVDPVFSGEIADDFIESGTAPPRPENESCRFLCKDPYGEGMACAIYASRPKVCRDFRCYRMIIRTREGTICGRVIAKNTIRTEDAILESLWREHVLIISFGDPVAWTKKVAGILAEHGYCADIVE
jgi:Fe-S-cluster containining protein